MSVNREWGFGKLGIVYRQAGHGGAVESGGEAERREVPVHERPGVVIADPNRSGPSGASVSSAARGASASSTDGEGRSCSEHLPGATSTGRPPRRRPRSCKFARMSDHVYKSVEITGTSPEGVTQAIDRAVAKASQTLRNLDWFELTSVRGQIVEGKVAHYQATLKIGFRLED
jgi:flavin-binding protein dodecin